MTFPFFFNSGIYYALLKLGILDFKMYLKVFQYLKRSLVLPNTDNFARRAAVA